MRIALATISLHQMPGGLEKNIIYLANFLASQGIEVLLLSFDRPNSTAFYPIDNRVQWHQLGRTKPHSRITFIERIRLIGRMRSCMSKPEPCDWLICFHHGILVRYFLATLGLVTKIICSERNSLSIYNYIRLSKWNLNFLMLFFVDRITVQFPDYILDYPRQLREKIHIVHNPVFPSKVDDICSREKVILSVGRYAQQKRFDLLVEACAIVFEHHPDWHLILIGDGTLRMELEQLVEDLEIGDYVSLLPASNELDDWFSKARIYCQPSQWEGFPNAQVEAMAAGVIPIGFRETSGVSDLIESGENGLLCEGFPSVKALAKALSELIEQPEYWSKLSSNAKAVAQTYSVESWQQSWLQVIGLSSVSNS